MPQHIRESPCRIARKHQSHIGVAGDKAERIKMEKAYEEYFEGLAEGEEALSFAEFKEALS